MSEFSTTFQALFEDLGISRTALAEATRIPASTLHNLFHGNMRPDADLLERLLPAFESKTNRANLVLAHLRDETPASARDLIRIISLVDSADLPPEPPRKVKLPKSVREDFEYLECMAVKHPEVVDSIRSTVRILRGR